MADTVQFNLVSPERSLASMQVNEVQIPGSDGDMTAMADHAPTITTLRPGVLKVTGPEGDAEYVVTGGFAEIGESGISVLAERASQEQTWIKRHSKAWLMRRQTHLRKHKTPKAKRQTILLKRSRIRLP